MDFGFLFSATGLVAWMLLIAGVLAAVLGARIHTGFAVAGTAAAVAGAIVMMVAAGAVSIDGWPFGTDSLLGGSTEPKDLLSG